jgi:Secretion system C-terminal sorting domain/SprB repeat
MDNNERIPTIYLCGETDNQLLQTNISDAISVQWFLYDEAVCGAYPSSNCPITADSCWTNLVGTGSNYTVNEAGKYRVTFSFSGGATSTFYFNVYKNLLDPQVTSTNITCSNQGSIMVNNVPNTGYEFLLLKNSTAISSWQSSNIFTNINSSGVYTIQVRSTNFSAGCIFSVPNIQIQEQNIAVSAITTNLSCYGINDGTITVNVAGGIPPYLYSLTGPIVTTVPQVSNIFTGLPAGSYMVNVTDGSGCYSNTVVTITSPVPLSATLTVINNNSITVTATGGQVPYQYSIDNQPLQSSNIFSNLSIGNHTVKVVDANGCMLVSLVTIVPEILSVNDHFITSNDLVGEQNVGNVLDNDTFNGIQANASNVSLTVVTPALPKETGALFPYLNNTGSVLLPEGSLPGKYTIDYKICAVNDVNNCSSASAKINVTSKQINAPLGNTNQEFTEGSTLENLVVVGENISWYSLNTIGRTMDSNVIPLPLNTVLEDGKTYYASQTINDVEGFYRLPVTVTKFLSSKDFVFNTLKVYPNPVKSIITIQNSHLIQKIEILNILGQHLFLLEPNEFKSIVNFENFANGSYFMKITSSDNEKTIKFIKE